MQGGDPAACPCMNPKVAGDIFRTCDMPAINIFTIKPKKQAFFAYFLRLVRAAVRAQGPIQIPFEIRKTNEKTGKISNFEFLASKPSAIISNHEFRLANSNHLF